MTSSFLRASAALLLSVLAIDAGAQTPRFVGLWEGALQVGPQRLRIGLTVERDSAGGLRGYMTSIDQGNARMPSTMSASGDTLIVQMPASSASFRGVITARGDSLNGAFSQGAAIPLLLKRTTTLGVLNRPQEPKPPLPYRTEELSIESVPGVRLSGTLSLPAGTGPFPAVVFVTGSGPQDRDESLLGHKPFAVIADYLARRGIASLRYDDRGFGKSTGSFATATSADFANDAEAAVHALQRNALIVRDRVGIIGHSEGGLIGPIVAARSRDVAFLVLLAGPGISGDSILILQQRLVASAAGAAAADIEVGSRINKTMFAAVKAGGDSAAVVARILAGVREIYPTLPAQQRQQASAEDMARAVTRALTPWNWFVNFITYDPMPTLRQVRVPVLALNGTLDLQVPYKENLAAMDAAFKAAGNRDYRLVELPNLNHLFQTTKTGAVSEYGQIEETMSPPVLELIATWISERFVKK